MIRSARHIFKVASLSVLSAVVMFVLLVPNALSQSGRFEGRETEPQFEQNRRGELPAGFERPVSNRYEQPAYRRASPIVQTGHSEAFSGEFAEDDLKSRLSKVEEYINGQKAASAKKKADDAKKPTFKIGGRIHSDYWGFMNSSPGIGFYEHSDPASADFGNEPESRFQFRRIRLEMRGDIFENMMWRTQIDFNNPQTPELKDVWIGFKNLPYDHELLVGIQKRPLGMDHLNSSRFNVFTERPLVVEAFNEDARRPGITLYGNTDELDWGWAAGLYLLDNITTTGRYIGDSMQGSVNARLFNSPWYEDDGRNYFHWAMAGMFAKPDGDVDPGDTNANDGRFRTRAEARSSSRWLDTGRIRGADNYEIAAVEGLFNLGPLHIMTEYQAAWMQRDGSTPGTGPDVFFHGAYVHVAYFLTGEHIPYSRKSGTIGRALPFNPFNPVSMFRGGGSGWGAWQVAVRYSYLDLTDKDIMGGVEQNLEVALNWYFTSHSKLQMGVIIGDIEKHRPVAGYRSGDFTIAGIRFAADF